MGKGFEINDLGMAVWEGTPVVSQLTRAGVLRFLTPVENSEKTVLAQADEGLIPFLEAHDAFASGGLHLLHPDVGDHRRDFRSYRGAFGKGSLQIVVDERTGKFYADVDAWNPYADVVNWIGHAGEVIAGRLRRRRSTRN